MNLIVTSSLPCMSGTRVNSCGVSSQVAIMNTACGKQGNLLVCKLNDHYVDVEEDMSTNFVVHVHMHVSVQQLVKDVHIHVTVQQYHVNNWQFISTLSIQGKKSPFVHVLLGREL